MRTTAKLVSDTYIVQFLLQATRETGRQAAPLVWQEKESGAYTASISGVRLELAREHAATGSRIFLTLFRGAEKVHITEPHRTLRGRYKGEHEQQLAGLMKQLEQAAGRQCFERQSRSPEAWAQVRNAIYCQLLFQDQADTLEST